MKFVVKVRKELCKGCAYCVSACARNILHLSDALNKKGHHYVEVDESKDCSGCKNCAEMCPDAAIEIEKKEDD